MTTNNNVARTKKNDLDFGNMNEVQALIFLRRVFSKMKNIRNTKEKYGDEFCIFDFESDSLKSFELKSRRNTMIKYKTTILPVNKIRNVDTSQFFLFHFTDYICYIKYDKKLFKSYTKNNYRTHRDGEYTDYKLHYDIPISDLIILEKFESYKEESDDPFSD